MIVAQYRQDFISRQHENKNLRLIVVVINQMTAARCILNRLANVGLTFNA